MSKRPTRFSLPGFEPPRLDTGHDEPELFVDHAGWLQGDGVDIVPSHASWHYPELATPDSEPIGLVSHYTATKWGTASSMARRRVKRRKDGQRAASWHVTIGHDGTITQLVSLKAGAWHCRGKVEDGLVRYSVNRSLLGMELEGHGDQFPEAQVAAATRFLSAIAYHYDLPRASLTYTHEQFDPRRRSDPGPLWAKEVLPGILDGIYQGRDSLHFPSV